MCIRGSPYIDISEAECGLRGGEARWRSAKKVWGGCCEAPPPPPSKGNTGRLNFIALSCMNRNRYEAEPGYGETRYDANRARLKRQPKKTKQAKGKL